MKTYQISRNSTWKGRHIIRIPRQCENPPCDIRSDTDEEEQRKEKEGAIQEEEGEKNELMNLIDII